jgi:hypothetical protein
MSLQAVHHSPYRSTALAATATALVIGGLAAAGFALSSTHDAAPHVSPARVQPGPRIGLHDFTSPGVEPYGSQSPLVGLHDFHQAKVRSVPIRRG